MNIFAEGRETVTKRIAASYLGQDVVFADCAVKGVILHWEGTTVVMHVLGTRTGSTAAYLTSNGATVTLDGPWPAGLTIATLKTAASNGSTKVTNGTFAADSDWLKGTNWTISGTAILTPGTSSGTLSQDVSAVATETYLLTYTLVLNAGDSITPTLGGVDGETRTASGTYSEEVIATSTGHLIFTPSGDDVDATIDDVSVVKVTPANVSVIGWR